MSAENVVAVIIRDIPQMTAYTEELVEFMQKVQSLRRQMTKARSYHDRQQIASQIRILAQELSQHNGGVGRDIKHDAINRIFDHLEGRLEGRDDD